MDMRQLPIPSNTMADQQGPEVNGRIFELGGGFVSEVRYERNEGKCSDLRRSQGRVDQSRS